jgi:hypothetical protein
LKTALSLVVIATLISCGNRKSEIQTSSAARDTASPSSVRPSWATNSLASAEIEVLNKWYAARQDKPHVSWVSESSAHRFLAVLAVTPGVDSGIRVDFWRRPIQSASTPVAMSEPTPGDPEPATLIAFLPITADTLPDLLLLVHPDDGTYPVLIAWAPSGVTEELQSRYEDVLVSAPDSVPFIRKGDRLCSFGLPGSVRAGSAWFVWSNNGLVRVATPRPCP